MFRYFPDEAGVTSVIPSPKLHFFHTENCVNKRGFQPISTATQSIGLLALSRAGLAGAIVKLKRYRSGRSDGGGLAFLRQGCD